MTKFLPSAVSKFLVCYGVSVILDPVLILIVDLGYHNYDCTSYSNACADNITLNSCLCYNGDFIKLYYKSVAVEGSGIMGIIVTILLYISYSIISILLLYEYLVYVHEDARILDLWRRTTGKKNINIFIHL